MANSIRGRAEANAEGVANVRLIINHPMSLERRDAGGQLIPAHFIEEITAKYNNEVVFTGLWGMAVSQNPYLSFQLLGAKKGDTLTVSWRDNKGESDTSQITIG